MDYSRDCRTIGHDLCVEVYRRTLYQPYRMHTTRNTSYVISGVSKARGVVGVMSALVEYDDGGMTGLVILGRYFYQPLSGTVSFAVLAATYVVTTRVTRHRLQHNGQEMAAADIHRLKALREGLDGIRDVLLDGTQALYSEIFRRANLRMSLARPKAASYLEARN